MRSCEIVAVGGFPDLSKLLNPKGVASAFPGLGIQTLRVGLDLPVSLSCPTSFIRASGDRDFIPSTPAKFIIRKGTRTEGNPFSICSWGKPPLRVQQFAQVGEPAHRNYFTRPQCFTTATVSQDRAGSLLTTNY